MTLAGMAPVSRISVTPATKEQLLTAATQGKGVESWMFLFIRHDPEFQAELFRTAERAQNWRFLESFSQFRAQQRKATPPPVARLKTEASTYKTAGKTAPQHAKARERHNKRRAQRRSPPRKVFPTRPTRPLTQASDAEFLNCPLCGLRLLNRVLQDHMELSCRHRRQTGGIVPDSLGGKHSNGISILYCRCGAPAIPGDSCCYNCKHT